MASITTLGFYTRLELRLPAIQRKGLSIFINHFAEMLCFICFYEEIKHIHKYHNRTYKNEQKTEFG